MLIESSDLIKELKARGIEQEDDELLEKINDAIKAAYKAEKLTICGFNLNDISELCARLCVMGVTPDKITEFNNGFDKGYEAAIVNIKNKLIEKTEKEILNAGRKNGTV